MCDAGQAIFEQFEATASLKFASASTLVEEQVSCLLSVNERAMLCSGIL